MDITGAIKSVATVVSQWMSRVWGTQTRDQSAVERDIANATLQHDGVRRIEWAAHGDQVEAPGNSN